MLVNLVASKAALRFRSKRRQRTVVRICLDKTSERKNFLDVELFLDGRAVVFDSPQARFYYEKHEQEKGGFTRELGYFYNRLYRILKATRGCCTLYVASEHAIVSPFFTRGYILEKKWGRTTILRQERFCNSYDLIISDCEKVSASKTKVNPFFFWNEFDSCRI